MKRAVGGGGGWWDRRGVLLSLATDCTTGLRTPYGSFSLWAGSFYSAFGQALSTSLEVILGLMHLCKQVLLMIFFDLEGQVYFFSPFWGPVHGAGEWGGGTNGLK